MEQDFKLPEYLSLQGNPSENWRRWLQRFELYLVAKKKTKKPDETTGGPDVVFDSSADIKTTYENTLNIALNRTCIKDLNENVLHYVYLTLF